jgi:sec-independent protein translocase protein TatB
MFGIGLWEALLVLAVAIIVLGPDRCVAMAKSAGGIVGRARRGLDDIRRDLDIEGNPGDPE